MRRSLLDGLARRPVLAVLFCLLPLGLPAALAESKEDQRLEQGEEIYRAHCASCHGEDLEGQADWRRRLPNGRLPAPPHDESGHTWHHPDEQLVLITKYGPSFLVPGYESDMPAFEKTLTDEEVRAALAYIKSRWPEEIRERQAEINRRAEQ
jgi:mono/diheme cytochrome c family protein